VTRKEELVQSPHDDGNVNPSSESVMSMSAATAANVTNATSAATPNGYSQPVNGCYNHMSYMGNPAAAAAAAQAAHQQYLAASAAQQAALAAAAQGGGQATTLSTHCQPSGHQASTSPAFFNMGSILNQKDSRWLQLEVCREYQRHKCSRSETECKFAHPPDNLEVQNGRVTACYDSIKASEDTKFRARRGDSALIWAGDLSKTGGRSLSLLDGPPMPKGGKEESPTFCGKRLIKANGDGPFACRAW